MSAKPVELGTGTAGRKRRCVWEEWEEEEKEEEKRHEAS